MLDQGAYRQWNEGMFRGRRPGGEGDALRRSLDAVVAAWRADMTKIITVPCRGEYSRRVGGNALLITEATMVAGEEFRRALRLFG